jgi:maspardin
MIMFATEYQVNQVDSLPQRQLASRLALLCHNKIIDHASIEIPDEKITIMDTMDGSIYPRKMIDRLHEIYPRSRHAILKTGGTAPYLSRSDEVNIYLLVHLRNVCGLNLPVYSDQPEEESQTPSVEQEQVLVSWNQE